MAFDGVVINSLARELNEVLSGSRIEKVHQPEKDEISLKIKSRDGSCKLVISASASTPMIYISNKHDKINPKKAPLFCMTLRKHIQGAIISSVEQVEFERIIRISIEGYDELREKTTKYLYIEIMSKHSNIVLVNEKDNKIIDSIKRIPLSVSRVRQVLPGNLYELPPKQNKINPMKNICSDDVRRYRDDFISQGKKMEVYKFIYMAIQGISPVIAEKICYDSNIDKNIRIENIDDLMLDKIIASVLSIRKELEEGKFYPNIVIDDRTDKVVEYSCLKLDQYTDYRIDEKHSISEMIEDYYYLKDKMERISQRASNLKKSLLIKYERVSKKIVKQKKELENSLEADKYKKLGELITAYIYKIKFGDENVEVEDFYNNNEKIIITLDPNLSPSENAQRYFKKYNKLKKANEELTVLIEENIDEKKYLENTILSIENCDSLDELKEIREELMREGYIRTYKMPKKNIKPSSEMLRFKTKTGKLIIVGKNNKQNDYLTLRLADNEDMWFHTKDIPGSHVVLKSAGKDIVDTDIIEAATLAAYYSKARMSENVAVDYTQKKNVKKPSGAKPGLVIYEKNNTIYVTPSDENKAAISSEKIIDN